MSTKTDEQRAAEWEARIDLTEPMREICQRLGLPYNLTAHIDFKPGRVIAEVFVPNEHGSPHIDLTTGDAVMEILDFKVLC